MVKFCFHCVNFPCYQIVLMWFFQLAGSYFYHLGIMVTLKNVLTQNQHSTGTFMGPISLAIFPKRDILKLLAKHTVQKQTVPRSSHLTHVIHSSPYQHNTNLALLQVHDVPFPQLPAGGYSHSWSSVPEWDRYYQPGENWKQITTGQLISEFPIFVSCNPEFTVSQNPHPISCLF